MMASGIASYLTRLLAKVFAGKIGLEPTIFRLTVCSLYHLSFFPRWVISLASNHRKERTTTGSTLENMKAVFYMQKCPTLLIGLISDYSILRLGYISNLHIRGTTGEVMGSSTLLQPILCYSTFKYLWRDIWDLNPSSPH